MSFWAYMLHCNGGYFYVGQTDDLGRRLAQHESGTIPGFSKDHLPVALVWSEEFSTRIEALEAERRIKGWSRAKKLALIGGDWKEISRLAKTKGRASTGLARTGVFERELVPHQGFQPHRVEAVSASLSRSAARWRLDYTVVGGPVRMPPRAQPARRDGLWRTTCFEMFAMPIDGDAYWEFNFAPSTQWAAYRFDRYRGGMREWEVAVPIIESIESGVHVLLDLSKIQTAGLRLGLSAVIEETDGTKSYWALAHPPGAPDFHAPDCFALELPPKDAT